MPRYWKIAVLITAILVNLPLLVLLLWYQPLNLKEKFHLARAFPSQFLYCLVFLPVVAWLVARANARIHAAFDARLKGLDESARERWKKSLLGKIWKNFLGHPLRATLGFFALGLGVAFVEAGGEGIEAYTRTPERANALQRLAQTWRNFAAGTDPAKLADVRRQALPPEEIDDWEKCAKEALSLPPGEPAASKAFALIRSDMQSKEDDNDALMTEANRVELAVDITLGLHCLFAMAFLFGVKERYERFFPRLFEEPAIKSAGLDLIMATTGLALWTGFRSYVEEEVEAVLGHPPGGFQGMFFTGVVLVGIAVFYVVCFHGESFVKQFKDLIVPAAGFFFVFLPGIALEKFRLTFGAQMEVSNLIATALVVVVAAMIYWMVTSEPPADPAPRDPAG